MKQGMTLRILFNTALLVLLSFGVLGAACNHIKVPNTRAVAVAGKITGGAFWAETLSQGSGDLTMGEFIDFLEPYPKQVSEDGTIVFEGKGAAICQSANDWIKQKTAMEQLCAALKKQCSYELKEAIDTVKKNIDGLQKRSNNIRMEK